MSDVAASPRRREEARRRGDVAVSPALVGGAALFAGLGALLAIGEPLGARLVALLRHALAGAPGPTVAALVGEAWGVVGLAALPAAAALLAGAAAGLLQTRFVLAAPSRRPAAGTARAEVLRPLRAAAFASVALAAIVLACRGEMHALSPLRATGAPLLSLSARALGRVALRVAAVMAGAGVVDFALRRIAWARALRMTRGEAARERREEEGDPRLRAERSRRQRPPAPAAPPPGGSG